MPSFLYIVPVIFSVVFGIFGIAINSPILNMYIRLWRKVSSPSVSDQILFSISLTGLLLQCSLLINSLFVSLKTVTEMNTHFLLFSFYAVYVVFNMSFWNTAWLSICYCVKLVNTSHRIVLRFKAWFSSSIKKLLIGSAVSSILVTLPLFWVTQVTFLQNKTITDESLYFKMEVNVYYGAFLLLFGYLLPFTLTVLCIGLSVTSLLHHIWEIRQNVSQFGSSPQLKTLVRAVVTMTLRVVLDQSFLIIMVYIFAMLFNLESVTTLVFGLFFLSYPTVQTFVLFFGNPKLREKKLGQGSASEVTT